jgi:glutamate 5-kinase
MSERVLVKLGSNVVNGGRGLNEEVLLNRVKELVQLKRRGCRVILVSSGAVAAGAALRPDITCDSVRSYFSGLSPDELKTKREQILFGIGQPELMRVYSKMMQIHGVQPSQVLTEAKHFSDPRALDNMRGPIEYAMTDPGTIPVANENDLTSVEELRFTDNDHLASLIAKEFSVERAFMLSTTNGIYDRDPEDSDAHLLREIDHRRFSEGQVSFGRQSSLGRGGPASKIFHALEMAKNGTEVFVANGTRERIIHDILAHREGQIGDEQVEYTRFGV